MPLLRPPQQPLLDGRAAIADGEHVLRIDLGLFEQIADEAAFDVGANDRDQHGFRPERGHHRGDAARPAQPMLLLADPQDGNRGLGADPLDVAKQVAIEHHVAHQQDPRAHTPTQQ